MLNCQRKHQGIYHGTNKSTHWEMLNAAEPCVISLSKSMSAAGGGAVVQFRTSNQEIRGLVVAS